MAAEDVRSGSSSPAVELQLCPVPNSVPTSKWDRNSDCPGGQFRRFSASEMSASLASSAQLALSFRTQGNAPFSRDPIRERMKVAD